MQVVNATPPADFPAQCIMLDKEFARRHPDKGFYLRVQEGNGDVTHVELTGAVALPQARVMAKGLGYAPTHWMEITDLAPWRF